MIDFNCLLLLTRLVVFRFVENFVNRVIPTRRLKFKTTNYVRRRPGKHCLISEFNGGVIKPFFSTHRIVTQLNRYKIS